MTIGQHLTTGHASGEWYPSVAQQPYVAYRVLFAVSDWLLVRGCDKG